MTNVRSGVHRPLSDIALDEQITSGNVTMEIPCTLFEKSDSENHQIHH